MTLQSALNEYKIQPLPDLLLELCECRCVSWTLAAPQELLQMSDGHCAWQLPTFAKFSIFPTAAYNGFQFCSQCGAPLVVLLQWSPVPTVNSSRANLSHVIHGDVLLQSMLYLSTVTAKSPYSWHSHLPSSENKIGHVWAVSHSLTGMSWGWKSEPSQTYKGSESSHLTLKIGSES